MAARRRSPLGPHRPAPAATFGGVRGVRLFVSAALPPGRRPSVWLDRWLLRRAAVVVAFGEAEAERCRRLGVRPEHVAVVAPGVRPSPLTPTPLPGLSGRGGRVERRRPVAARRRAASSRTRASAMPSGHWTFCTIFTRICASYWSAAVPTGRAWNSSPAAWRWSDACYSPVARPDLTPWLHAAELAWVPSRAGGGVCAALEAMAAGRPVIATRLPALAEVVDGRRRRLPRAARRQDRAGAADALPAQRPGPLPRLR